MRKFDTQAKFLTEDEKAWVARTLADERKAKEEVRTFTTWESLIDPKVLLLSLNYLGIVTASLGMLFFIKVYWRHQQYSGRLVDDGALYLRRRWSHRLGGHIRSYERAAVEFADCMHRLHPWSCHRWLDDGHMVGALAVCRLPQWALGSKGPFWAMPPMFLTGTAAAAAIAWINSIGNLGGFFGPWYVGIMKDATDSFSGGLYGLALLGLIAALICAFALHIPAARGFLSPQQALSSRLVIERG